MKSLPLVSVVIPTYFRNERVEEAIHSVKEQTYDNINIIVVDDSGEEHARPVVEGYDLKYIPHGENRGGNEARNTGIQVANGEYIQLLDDDDIIFKTKIEKQIELLQSSPDVGVAYCGIVDRNGEILLPPQIAPEETLEHALKFSLPTAFTSSLLIKGHHLRSVYPLKNREAADDIGMKIELAKITNFDYINNPLVEIRESQNNRSNKLAFGDEHANIITEYEELYEQFAPSVRQCALRTTFTRLATGLLQKKGWSPLATFYFCKALYHGRTIDLELVITILASIFGKPGIELAAKFRDTIFNL